MSNNSEAPKDNWWRNYSSGAVNTGIGMIAGHQAERRNYRNNRNLMGLQNEYQRGLNEQGHELQMDMWNKTNYGAQVGHMKDAGLNPALMYGGAGQGGQSGSQGGGSASMGSSSQGKQMGMENMLVGAQINSLNAKAKSDNANADATSGYQGDESRSRRDLNITLSNNNMATLDLIKANTKFKGVETDIKEIEKSMTLEQLTENIAKTRAEWMKLNTDKDLTLANMNNIVRLTAAQSWKTINENRLIDSKVDLTNEQVNKVAAEIDVMFGNLNVNVGRLSNEEAKTMLIKKQQQLEVVLTGMKIDDNQKRAIVQSMTQILTSLIGSGTKLVTESMDKRD